MVRRVVVLVVGMVVITLLAGAPFLGVLVASSVAQWGGCQLDESGSHPCVIGGNDYGDLLGTLLIGGWFALITLPVGGIVLVFWVVGWLVFVIIRVAQERSAAAAPPAPPA